MTAIGHIEVAPGVRAPVPLLGRFSRRDQEQIELAMAAFADGMREFGQVAIITGLELRAVRVALEHARRESRVTHGLAGLKAAAMFPTARLERALRLNAERAASGVQDAEEAAPVSDAELLRNTWLARIDEIDAELVRLREERKQARKLKPLKRRDRVIRRNGAQQLALNDTRAAIITALEQAQEEAWREQRRAEVATLEALRGGVVEIVEREVVTPLIRDGAEVWRRGKQTMVRERISVPVILTRDGLHTLATAHLKADGEPRIQDGVAMTPLFDPNQLAALERYRIDFEAGDPDWSLKAVDTSAVSTDREAFDPARSMVDVTLFNKAKAVGRLKALDMAVSRDAGATALVVLREVAGLGNTIRSLAPARRKAIRLTRALLSAADVLADKYGLY